MYTVGLNTHCRRPPGTQEARHPPITQMKRYSQVGFIWFIKGNTNHASTGQAFPLLNWNQRPPVKPRQKGSRWFTSGFCLSSRPCSTDRLPFGTHQLRYICLSQGISCHTITFLWFVLVGSLIKVKECISRKVIITIISSRKLFAFVLFTQYVRDSSTMLACMSISFFKFTKYMHITCIWTN